MRDYANENIKEAHIFMRSYIGLNFIAIPDRRQLSIISPPLRGRELFGKPDAGSVGEFFHIKEEK